MTKLKWIDDEKNDFILGKIVSVNDKTFEELTEEDCDFIRYIKLAVNSIEYKWIKITVNEEPKKINEGFSAALLINHPEYKYDGNLSTTIGGLIIQFGRALFERKRRKP